jgi:benzoyl-CoA reductase subunit C
MGEVKMGDSTDLIRRHLEIAQDEQRRGRPVMGTLCSHVPVEILHAFGVLPVRLWGQAEEIARADVLLQTYICPPVRHLMALSLSGRYDFLDGLIHTYCCDATCGLFNIWRRNRKPRFSRMVSLPYQATEEAVDYAVAEFRGLIDALADFTGKPFSEKALAGSIRLYEEARGLLRDLYRLKQEGAAIPYSEIYRLNLLFQLLPIERFIPLCREYRPPAAAAVSAKQIRILLSGSVVTDEEILERIELLGGRIVADDTCLGLRPLQGRVAENEDPVRALAAFYLGRPPCASRADLPSRRRYLMETIDSAGAEAVIFIHQKFCDPHLSDHPLLKQTLEERGIPQLQFELEGEGMTGQLQTRLEGFFEMLEGRAWR